MGIFLPMVMVTLMPSSTCSHSAKLFMKLGKNSGAHFVNDIIQLQDKSSKNDECLIKNKSIIPFIPPSDSTQTRLVAYSQSPFWCENWRGSGEREITRYLFSLALFLRCPPYRRVWHSRLERSQPYHLQFWSPRVIVLAPDFYQHGQLWIWRCARKIRDC